MIRRRQLLASATTSISAISGCLDRNENEDNNDNNGRLITHSEIISQPTAAAPGEVEFALTNEYDHQVSVIANGKPPFVNFERLHGRFGQIVMLPDHHTMDANVASSRIEDCWRFRDPNGNETYISYADVELPVSLTKGGTHNARHRVYFDGEEGNCFPDGEYINTHTIEFEEKDSEVKLLVTVTFSHGNIENTAISRVQ